MHGNFGRERQPASIARRYAKILWGEVNHQNKLAEGVWLFDCSGHGGIIVDTDIHPSMFRGEGADQIPTKEDSGLLDLAEQHFAAYEEDCEAAKVEWLIPAVRKKLYKHFQTEKPFEDWWEERVQVLRDSLEQWNPGFLAQHPEPTILQ